VNNAKIRTDINEMDVNESKAGTVPIAVAARSRA
jgi:hypothetical protein